MNSPEVEPPRQPDIPPTVLDESPQAEHETNAAPQSLMDDVLGSEPQHSQSVSALEAFLSTNRVGQALKLWLSDLTPYENDKDSLARRLNADVAVIDDLVERQTNVIIHHPKFQKLEASYRGLWYLVEHAAQEEVPNVVIRVLNISWRDVVRDLDRAVEFDQSQLFRKIYENEFGTPGGKPFGVMIGDYEIHPRPTAEHPTDDVAALAELSQIAAAAFCPFIAAAHPSMFGLNEYQNLEHVENLERGFDQPEFIKWRAFREMDDARFVALTLPRVLMRTPIETTSSQGNLFCFREDVSGTDFNKYLWGNAAYAFGEVAIRAFAQTGWLADIRGVTRDVESGGIVAGLPVHYFKTDREGVASKSSTETVISEFQESTLNQLGFLPLCDCHDTEFSAFFSSQSVQKPQVYDRPAATQNAKISSMLQYTLCASRFAQYLKVIARDKVGSFATPDDCAKMLTRWITQYVTPDEHAKAEVKAQRPLSEAEVRVVPEPGNPGNYLCTFRLRPHYQFDNLNATIQLRTKIDDNVTPRPT